MLKSMKLQQRNMPLNTSHHCPEHLGNRLPFVNAAENQHIRTKYGRLVCLAPVRLKPAMIPYLVGLGAYSGSILREAILHTTKNPCTARSG